MITFLRRMATTLAAAAALTLALPSLAAEHAVVLIYHHVADNTPASTTISPHNFRAQLDWLAAHDFHVWPLSKLLHTLAAGKPVPTDTVAITFDDAYESVYTEAAPMLEAHGWPFTVFVATGYIDGDYRGYMSWQQLRELTRRGAEIGNHTVHHPHLIRRRTNETRAHWRQRVTSEITDAERRLKAQLSDTVSIIAWPYGEYDHDLEKIARSLGFYAMGQQSGAISPRSDFESLPRFPMSNHFAAIDQFATKVRTRALPVRIVAPASHVVAVGDDRPLLTLAVGNGRFDPARLQCYASGQGRIAIHWRGHDHRVVNVRADKPLAPGRSKYNCTAPATDTAGVWYWYSYLWMKREPDGRWYRD